jgi:hypothetical protein
MHTTLSFAFVLTYGVLVWRWSADLRDKLGPALQSRLAKKGGGAQRPRQANALHVALLFVTTFLPVIGLSLAAHFHAISWQRANSMLVFSLMLPALAFLVGQRQNRERS